MLHSTAKILKTMHQCSAKQYIQVQYLIMMRSNTQANQVKIVVQEVDKEKINT